MELTENLARRGWRSTSSFRQVEMRCAKCFSVLKMKELGGKGAYRCLVGSSRRMWKTSPVFLVSASQRK